MRALFLPSELKGRSVFGTAKKAPLDRCRVEQIKRLSIIVYGEAEVTEKVWAEYIASMNAHLPKYHKFDLN